MSAHETDSWESFHARSHAYLDAQQENLRSAFRLGEWQQYHYDQDAETLTFSSAGRAGLVARIQVVGSTSNRSRTWLWAWANPTILEPVRSRLSVVRQFGLRNDFRRLVEPSWPGDEIDGWEMTAAAAYLLEAAGAYRAPSEEGALFLLIFDPVLVGS